MSESGQEMDSPQIPDELMPDILLRIANPADLTRAAAACVAFRRIVTDRSFLRLYRKLHARPFLGFLDRRNVFHPAIAPHPSASAARAVALAADFTFSFLPAPASDWVVRDTRDGRVLLHRPPPEQQDIYYDDEYNLFFPEMVVCDPLHRHYVVLHAIPAHLAAMVEPPLLTRQYTYCETFLAPPGDGEASASASASAAKETSFSVFWMAQCRTKLVVFVFSSSTRQWRAISSQSWSDLFADGLLSSTGSSTLFTCRQYAYGSFYWVADWRETLLVLDTQRMEFSIAETPLEARGFPAESTAIVEAGGGRLGILVHPQYANYLNYTIRQNSCGSWQFEKTISVDSRYSFMGSTGRNLFLHQRRRRSLDAGCFSLDIETFQLERVFLSNSCIPIIHAYNNFPPSFLSTPTVSNGTGAGGEAED
ncbi:unnamed protein product [Alopecurus aequalis]